MKSKTENNIQEKKKKRNGSGAKLMVYIDVWKKLHEKNNDH